MTKANGETARGRERDEDLFSLLKADHRNFHKLFSQILKGHKRADDLFAQIKEPLEAHMRAEEKFFYPTLEQDEKAREFILEAYEEHEVGKKLIQQLEEQEDDEHWLARVKVLGDIIDHHVEEEEGEIFKQAKRLLDKRRLHEIARLVREEKEQGVLTPA